MKPSELMRACGSKTGQWEAESIEQWRWMARNAEGKEQALAWIRLKSIANQSPWCVDAETGRRLTIANMAGALGWTLKTAQNVCYALAKEERIVTEGGRIRYRADVSEESVAESVKTNENDFIQGHFSLEVTDFIRKLPREKREVVDAFLAWRPKFLAEAAAAARSIVERVERTTLAQVGCKKNYLPKRREVQLSHVQLTLTEAPDFVQGQLDDEIPLFVQSPKNGSYKPENGSVQGDASLVCSDPDSDKNKESVCLSPADRPTDLQNSNPIHDLLIAIWGERFPSEPVSPKLVRQISAALDGAPIEQLRHRMIQRRANATGMGFAVVLAKDVGIRHRQSERVDKARAATAGTSDPYKLGD